MSLPFLILAGTVAYTVIEGGGDGSGSGVGGSSSTTKTTSTSSASSSSSKQSSSTSGLLSIMTVPSGTSLSIFFSGLAVGVGLSLLASYELKRTRLWQRVRLQLLSWLYDDLSSISAAWTDGGLGRNDESDNITTSTTTTTTTGDNNMDDVRLVDKFRRPVKLETITGTPIPGPMSGDDDGDDDDEDNHQHNCGSHVDLVSSDWTLTNGMSVDMFTLAPGIELLPNKAKGVEFYFIVKGDGELVTRRSSSSRSSDDDDDGSTNSIHNRKERITQGMGFIIDPDTVRGFHTRKGKNLVLLRATDVSDVSAAGGGGSRSGESVGMHNGNSNSNKLSNAKNMIIAGLGKIQSMVEAYGSDPLPSNAVPRVNNYDGTFDQ